MHVGLYLCFGNPKRLVLGSGGAANWIPRCDALSVGNCPLVAGDRQPGGHAGRRCAASASELGRRAGSRRRRPRFFSGMS